MRRKKQQLPEEEAWEIVRTTEFGVLATVGPDGWPYGVPINHVVIDGELYFHGAAEGLKHQNMAFSDKACYTVVAAAEVIPEKFVTRYRSAICFGRLRRIEDPKKRDEILWKLSEHFAPGLTDLIEKEMETFADKTTVLELDVERITGKFHAGL